MTTYAEMMQMCRLCLVKEQVNLPIFDGQGEVQQIFLKITACLPVKVSREDNLPKNICDGCSYKLDLLYQFWNTSSNSEKQLIDWLTAAGVEPKQKSNEPIGLATQPNVILKQEPVTDLDARSSDAIDAISSDTQNYIIQQQQLAYKPEEYDESQQNLSNSTKKKAAADPNDESVSKRPRRSSSYVSTVKDYEDDSDEDYVDNTDAGIAKTEDESEEDDDDEDEDLEDEGDDMADPDFVAKEEEEDSQQPGPSGTKTTSGPTRGRPRKYYCKICMTGEGLTKDQAITHYQSEHNISNFKFYPLRKFVRVMPVCEICKEEFSSYKELDVHLREHKSLYPCTFCDKSFPTMVYHTQHQFLHVCHSKCVICSEELTEKEHVTKHYGKHGEHYKPYKCEELNCCMRFPDADSLLAHGKTHRKKTPKLKSTEPVKFQCEKCAQFYATPWYLKTHLETVHKEIAYEDFNCPICTKVCKGEAALKRHKRRAHMTPHQVCHICGKSIKASQMNLHQLRHGDKTFACPFCDKMFAIKMALVEHERIHNGKKPYPCQHCGKGFSQAGSRRIHERLHTNERPYVCEFCGKAFTSGGMLNVHKKKCIPKLELVS